MENKINKEIFLPNGQAFIIVDQAIYNNRNFYLLKRVENEELKEELLIVEEKNNEIFDVKESTLLRVLKENFDKRL